MTTPTQVTHTSATLVQVNGFKVLAPVGLPLLAVAVVAFTLWRRRKNETAGARWPAWVVTVLLVGVALLGMLSIGPFIVPVAVLVAVARARSSGGPVRQIQPPRTGLE
jgi:cytochrome bd-type quinol oxidase subunit 2